MYCYAVNCGNKANKPYYGGWCQKHGKMFVEPLGRYTAEELIEEARLVKPHEVQERLGVTAHHVRRTARRLGVKDLWMNY